MKDTPLSSLQYELDLANVQMQQMLPPDTIEMLEQSILQLKASGEAAGLKVGTQAPDFSLMDHKGTRFTLSELTSQGPVVLVFYRGWWCPFCNITLRAYQQALEPLEAKGACMIVISPQTQRHSTTMQVNNELSFPLLCDPQNEVASLYSLTFELPESIRGVYRSLNISLDDYNGDSSWRLPVPATYVIDPLNIIRMAHVEADYKRRLEPARILDMLSSLYNEV